MIKTSKNLNGKKWIYFGLIWATVMILFYALLDGFESYLDFFLRVFVVLAVGLLAGYVAKWGLTKIEDS